MTLFAGEDLVCRRGERLVFAGLSFAVDAGGAILLTGPNGSGKSSLLRLLAGLLPPASGRVAWRGENISESPGAHRARLHFIGHQDALKPVLTAAEMLGFWAALRGGGRVEEGLRRFRLGDLADWPCRFLSAGQRRRLALARLVAASAPLWLLDEPATGLDRDSMGDLEAAIAEHRTDGGVVILSTHAPIALGGAGALDLGDFAARGRAVADFA